MFITKKHLSRRMVLRGMGVSLALPLLDSMVPAQTPVAKTAAAPKTRLACIEMVHGAAGSTADGTEKHCWSPAEEGRDFKFSQTLEPLEPLREYITVVSDTDLHPATAPIALLPAPQLAIDELKIDGDPRRKSGDQRDQSLPVGFPGS